jgi:hypothetical protein
VRAVLYEAGHVILTKPLKGCTALKSWAMRIAKRAGMKKAAVALARKLAVIMDRMLADGKRAADQFFDRRPLLQGRLGQAPPPEPAVIDALARRWPRNVPAVVAADHQRGWMLMRDFGERSLDGEPIARWQAAQPYVCDHPGRLQRGPGALVAAGVPGSSHPRPRRVHGLPALVTPPRCGSTSRAG